MPFFPCFTLKYDACCVKEIEYFIPPGDVWKDFHKQWLANSKDYLLSVGLREELMEWDVHEDDSLAHYALACTDVTFRFPFGTQELMGIAARGNFDLTAHGEGSGKSENCHVHVHFCVCVW
mmetsp:Transcript_15480/g.34787  ORF Transcript_15480/g.34787 Transcript_15480/m.34787 type:complete len:121 (-) Transcript_15480:184-546(-)